MTAMHPDASQRAVVEAALMLLERMGLFPADLAAVPQPRPQVPTSAEYVLVVSAVVSAGRARQLSLIETSRNQLVVAVSEPPTSGAVTDLTRGSRAVLLSIRSLVALRRLMIVMARLVMAAERLRRAPTMGKTLSNCCIGDSLVEEGSAPTPCGRVPVQRPGRSSGHSAGETRRRRAWSLATGL